MRFVDACLGRPVDTTPIWIMRQAGRYLPEYRAVRDAASFLEMCRTPALAAEVTLQPLRRFDLDAAIVFSDILIPLPPMGVPVDFVPEPRIGGTVRTREQIAALRTPDPAADCGFLLEALSAVRAALPRDKALIGFAGAPFTLATYLVEGGGSKEYRATRRMMHETPGLFDDLLGRLVDVVAPYLAAQIDAGADAVQLFDSWGGVVGPAEFHRFVLPAARAVVKRVRRPGVPFIYFLNGVGGVAESLPSSGADVIGVDYRVDLGDAIRRMGPGTAVQGNLDPGVLLGPEAPLRQQARRVVEAGRAARGHVFNLGHGILRDTDPDRVAALVDEVHAAGRRTPDDGPATTPREPSP